MECIGKETLASVMGMCGGKERVFFGRLPAAATEVLQRREWMTRGLPTSISRDHWPTIYPPSTY